MRKCKEGKKGDGEKWVAYLREKDGRPAFKNKGVLDRCVRGKARPGGKSSNFYCGKKQRGSQKGGGEKGDQEKHPFQKRVGFLEWGKRTSRN